MLQFWRWSTLSWACSLLFRLTLSPQDCELYTRIKTHSPISCTGAAVSCLKLAVKFQTYRLFANWGQCCAKMSLQCWGCLFCSSYQCKKCCHLHLQCHPGFFLARYIAVVCFVIDTGWTSDHLMKSKRHKESSSSPAFTCSLGCCVGVLLVGVVE